MADIMHLFRVKETGRHMGASQVDVECLKVHLRDSEIHAHDHHSAECLHHADKYLEQHVVVRMETKGVFTMWH